MAIPRIRQEWPEVMSAQEVFDAAIAHIKAQQGQRAWTSTNGCVYRGPGGIACAVGALLTNAEARRVSVVGADSASAKRLANAGLLPARLLPHVELLLALQALHDSYRSDQAAVDIAQRFGLAYEPDPRAIWTERLEG